MKFIVTHIECANADCYEIVDVDTSVVGTEGIKAALTRKFSAYWHAPVRVRSYPEVAGDVRASDCEMAAAREIFLKRA